MRYLIGWLLGICCYFIFGVNCTSAEVKILAERSDVIISDDGVNIKCDGITCPEHTFGCRVVKKLDGQDPTLLHRTNTCYSKEGNLLFQSEKKRTVKKSWNRYLDLSADREGLVIVNEEIQSGFHLSTKNLSHLQGKVPSYIKVINNNFHDIEQVVAKKAASLRQ